MVCAIPMFGIRQVIFSPTTLNIVEIEKKIRWNLYENINNFKIIENDDELGLPMQRYFYFYLGHIKNIWEITVETCDCHDI